MQYAGLTPLSALLLGGLLGGFVVSRQGLKFGLCPMLLAIHLPDTVFIWLAYTQPEKLSVIGAGVAIELFGYGFGFTAFMLYMIYIARGEHRTAHYAICTGFVVLGMMIPGLWSGWLQSPLGYRHFFTRVILATIPVSLSRRTILLMWNLERRLRIERVRLVCNLLFRRHDERRQRGDHAANSHCQYRQPDVGRRRRLGLGPSISLAVQGNLGRGHFARLRALVFRAAFGSDLQPTLHPGQLMDTDIARGL